MLVMSQQSSRPNTPTTSVRHVPPVPKLPRKKLVVFVSDGMGTEDSLTDKRKETIESAIDTSRLSLVSESEYNPNSLDAAHHLFSAITAITGR